MFAIKDHHVERTNLDKSAGAIFSPCLKHRFFLWRHWDHKAKNDECIETVAFVGLNPSKATEARRDKTVSNCCGFAERWGYHRMWMLNICSLMETNPNIMLAADDPTLHDNIDYIRLFTNDADLTVCCWGSDAGKFDEDTYLVNAWEAIQRPTACLGRTAKGFPRHPSRLGYDTQLEEFLRL